MGDYHNGNARFLLKLAESLDYLRLNGDAKACGRLVGNKYGRVAYHRHGDEYSLAEACGKLTGELLHYLVAVAYAYELQNLYRLVMGFLFGSALLVDKVCFRKLAAKGKVGVEGGGRVLEYH